MARSRFSLATALLICVVGSGSASADPARTTQSHHALPCTVEGTPRSETLVGTLRRDVICGYGGDDRLVGRAGRDVLYGGRGRDQGSGHAGADELFGGPGTDSMRGGAQDDVVRGGPGDDRLLGEPQDDRLYGGQGDDVLNGGPGADELEGGPGRNRCLEVADDTAPAACDATPPRLISFDVLREEVDTSEGAQTVPVRVRLTDDLSGLSSDFHGGEPWVFLEAEHFGSGQRLSMFLYRVEGDDWDATYAGELVVPHYAASGRWLLRVTARDRAHNEKHYSSEFRQTGPGDTEAPRLLSFSLDKTSVDTSNSAREVTFTARVVDAISGVKDYDGVWLTAFHSGSTQSQWTRRVTRISGSAHDGIYEGTMELPRWAGQGVWTVGLDVRDNAGAFEFYGHQQLTAAGFQGSFTQIGPGDSEPPQLRTLTFSPDRVDTSASDQTVTAEARVTDNLAGASDVSFHLNHKGSGVLGVISGDENDGIRRGTVTMPRFSAQGPWPATVSLVDRVGNWVILDRADLERLGLPGFVHNGP